MPEASALEARATDLLRELIRFRTVNPPGDEAAIQERLKELLEGAGFACELICSQPGRPNLIARLAGRSDGPVLAYLGHVDTVLADPEEWSVDPWAGELKDDCVWGRGALDMKGQVAAEVAAVTALAEEGWRPESGELLVVLTADEEAGAEHGAQFLCEQHPDKVRCDLVVNEGGGDLVEIGGRRLYLACVAEKGVFRFTATTSGTAGHASIPKIGDNALVKMAPLLEAMGERQPSLELTQEPRAFLAALGIGADDPAQALEAVRTLDERVAMLLLEPMLGVTLTPTRISASEKINVIPSRARVKVDCRVPPELGEEHARARIAEVLGDDGYSVEFDEHVVGNRSEIETPLMGEIRSFVEREDPGAVIAPIALPGFTDSRWFREAFPGCIAYGFCPQRTLDFFEAAPLIHGADERIPVQDLGLAARFFAELAPRILG
jgi:acetylornithine deacetylase/succinyl-diaminopimelate desuccinylase-like protein